MSPSDADLMGIPLDRHPRIPSYVVYRAFVDETVVLNLETGTYHGLNAVGGRILEALDHAQTLHDALRSLALQFDAAAGAIEADVWGYCQDLIDRGLVIIDARDGRPSGG